jgi:hypothetical protein
MAPLTHYDGETDDEKKMVRIIHHFETGNFLSEDDRQEQLKTILRGPNSTYVSYGWKGMYDVQKEEEGVYYFRCKCCNKHLSDEKAHALALGKHVIQCRFSPLLPLLISDAMKKSGDEGSVEVDFEGLTDEELKKRIVAMWEVEEMSQIKYIRWMIAKYISMNGTERVNLAKAILKKIDPSYNGEHSYPNRRTIEPKELQRICVTVGRYAKSKKDEGDGPLVKKGKHNYRTS